MVEPLIAAPAPDVIDWDNPVSRNPVSDTSDELDWDNAIRTSVPGEQVYLENQRQVVELPHGGLDRLKAIASGAYDRGNAGAELSSLYARQMFGEDDAALQSRINTLRQIAGTEIGTKGGFEEVLRAGAEQTPQLLGLLGKGIERGAQASIAGSVVGATVAPPFPPVAKPAGAISGAVAGVGVGFTSGIAEYSFIQNAGEAYGDFSTMLDKKGVALENKNLARLGAVMVGAMNAGLDTVSFGALSKVFVGKNIVLDALKSSGAKSIVIPKTKDAIAKFIVNLSKAIATESVTEGAQEGVKDLGHNVTGYLSDQEFDSLKATEIFDNMSAAASEAAKATLALGGVAGVGKGAIAGGKKALELAGQKPAQAQPSTDAVVPDAPQPSTPSGQSPLPAAGVSVPEVQPSGRPAIDTSGMRRIQGESEIALDEATAPIRAEQEALRQKRLTDIQSETDDIALNAQRSISELMDNKEIVDPEIHTMLESQAQLMKERRGTKKPRKLTDFLRSIGGIKETGEELNAIGINKRQRVRNDKSGLDLDEAGLRAFEAGYFLEQPTEADLLAALADDFKGHRDVVPIKDMGDLSRLEEIDDSLAQIDQALDEKGISTEARATLIDLRRRIAVNKRLDRAAAREQKAEEVKLRSLGKVKEHIANSTPKILADKLQTFVNGIRKGGQLQKAETKAVQEDIIEMLESSELEAADKAKFIRAIKNTQTPNQIAQVEEIQQRISSLLDDSKRRNIKANIKSTLLKTKVKKQSGKPIGKLGAEVQEMLDPLREAMKLTQEQAQAKLDANLSNGGVPSLSQSLINRALAISANDDSVSAETLQEFLDDVTVIINNGKVQRKNSQFAKAVRVGSMKIQAFDEITKGENLDIIDETTWRRKLQRLGNNIKALQDGWLFGWYDIPDILFGKSSLRDDLRVGEQVSAGKKIIREQMEKIEIAAQKAFGFTKRKQWINKIIEDSQVIDLGVMPDANGHPVRVQFTKAQMRKLWMELQDPTLRKTLFSEKSGNKYTDDMVKAITQYLTPEDIEFAKAQLDIYQEFYKDVNKVYSSLYGVNLPQNPNYSPISREVEGGVDEGVFLDEQNYRRSVTSGSLISRVQNTRKIRQQSDVETYQNHIMEMAHFIAFSEKVRQINSVFSDGNVRKAIEKKHGKAMVKIIDEYIALLVRGGSERANVFGKIINTLNRNFAVSVLGGKLALIPKQITSFVASAADMPTGEWAKGIADFAKNPSAAIETLSQSEMLKARGASPEHDIASFGKSIDWNIFKKKQKFDEIMLTPIRLGDRGAIYLGGWPIYRHAIKQGKTHEQAIKAFETWFETTQQSGSIDQLSLAQAASPFVRTFTMFRSAPAAYLRAEIRALRHWHNKEISGVELGKKLAIYHVIIPSLFQFVANGFEWDDEDQARAAVLGPVDGYFIIGDAIARAAGGYSASESTFAAFSKDIAKGMKEILTSGWDMDDIAEGIKDLSKGAGTASGLPVGQAENIVEGMEDLGEGDTGDGVKRILGWPKSAVGNSK